MKLQVRSATLKYYNANSRGVDTEDCVKRAISLAFDIPYAELSKLLNAKMHEKRQTSWRIRPVYESVIYDIGGYRYKDIKDKKMTVDEFADEHPNGSYVLYTGKTENRSLHLVCVRDGKVWDSWDSRDLFVFGFYKADTSKVIIERTVEEMQDIAKNILQPVVEEQVRKFAANKKWVLYKKHGVNMIARADRFKPIVECRVDIMPDGILNKKREYRFTVQLTIEPTWTDEEIEKFVISKGKERTYDRMYAIKEQEQKLREAVRMRRQSERLGFTDRPIVDPKFLTSQERRYLNTLPGWVQALVKDIDIQQPNKFPDSYRLQLWKHPCDTRHPNLKYFTLEGWDPQDISIQITRYKEDAYSLPWIDYSPDW